MLSYPICSFERVHFVLLSKIYNVHLSVIILRTCICVFINVGVWTVYVRKAQCLYLAVMCLKLKLVTF